MTTDLKKNTIEGKINKSQYNQWIKFAAYAAFVIILSTLPLFIKSVYFIHILILMFIYIIATSSLRTIAISGQISLGHGAFMGIGAYTAGILAKQLGWSPWFSIPLGAVTAMAVGILIGYPFTRLRTLYFSIASLFFGLAILAVSSVLAKYTGGSSGMGGIPPLFGNSKLPYYYFFLGLAVVCLSALYRFEFSRIGTNLKAVAQSHLVASSVGIDEARYRRLAIAVGCFFAGLAGAGYAHYNLVLSHSSFDLLASIYLLIYMMVGGMESFAGPIFGTAVLIIIPEFFRNLKEYSPYIYVVILILITFLMPQGIVGLYGYAKSWLAKAHKLKGGPCFWKLRD